MNIIDMSLITDGVIEDERAYHFDSEEEAREVYEEIGDLIFDHKRKEEKTYGYFDLWDRKGNHIIRVFCALENLEKHMEKNGASDSSEVIDEEIKDWRCPFCGCTETEVVNAYGNSADQSVTVGFCAEEICKKCGVSLVSIPRIKESVDFIVERMRKHRE